MNLEEEEAVEGSQPPERLLGLDGEMSSNDLTTGGRLIQAGFAIREEGELRVFSTLIGWDEMEWSERAAQVHGLSRADLAGAPTPAQADEACVKWLLANGATAGRRTLVSVGLNVVGFDHPFFRHALPRTMELISRRGVDLNASCFLLDGWDPDPTAAARDWKGWKRSMKRAADTQLTRMGVAGRPHDAGWDAAQALLGLEWLQAQVAGARRPRRDEARAGQDPALVAALGAGLLARLEKTLAPEDVSRVAQAVTEAAERTGKTPGVLIGRKRPALAGASVLELLEDQRIEEAVAALASTGRST